MILKFLIFITCFYNIIYSIYTTQLSKVKKNELIQLSEYLISIQSKNFDSNINQHQLAKIKVLSINNKYLHMKFIVMD